MFLALTGTPGTGKTTTAGLLQAKGFSVVDLHAFAIDKHVTEGIDPKRNSVILDPERLTPLVEENFDRKTDVIFEGHLTHLLSCMDKIVILRCRPDVLKQRLEKKGWNIEKIRENLEAEIIDVVLCEAVDIHGESNVFEMNTTDVSPERITGDILELFSNGFSMRDDFKVGQIDWSDYASNEFIMDR